MICLAIISPRPVPADARPGVSTRVKRSKRVATASAGCRARCPDADFEARVRGADQHLDPAAGRGELDGVGEQVRQHLHEPAAIALPPAWALAGGVEA